MLVGRWGILWRPIRLRVAKASQVVLVCCKLQNFIIDHNGRGTLPFILSSDTGGELREIHLQDDCDSSEEIHRRRRDLELSSLWESFTEDTNALGFVRPQ
jgi:hypothetical protein